MVNQEVVTPAEIGELKQALVEAVTNAYMAKRIPEVTGLKWDWGSCSEKQFRYKSPQAGWDVGYYVSYPGGVWSQDKRWMPDQDLGPFSRTYGSGSLFAAPDVYAQVARDVSEWIDPWIDTCPDPMEFQAEIDRIAAVSHLLYIDDEVNYEVDGSGSAKMSPISDIRSAVDELEIQANKCRGAAVDAFKRTYVADLPRTIAGQRALVSGAGLALVAEGIAWNETLTSLRDFMLAATYDFNAFANDSDGDNGTLNPVLGAVAAVTGLAAATVGIAFPPFGAAMGVVSATTGAASLMFPVTEGSERKQLAVHGHTYEEFWTSFTGSILGISQELTHAETSIGDGCRRILDDYFRNPDNYSLTSTFKTIDIDGLQGPLDDLKPFMALEVRVEGGSWKLMAGAAESIAEHQRSVGAVLGGDQPILDTYPWRRGELPMWGTIGFVAAWEPLLKILRATTDLLALEGKTGHRVAEQCLDIATDFQVTDHDAERRLDRLSGLFDTVPFPGSVA